MASSLIELDLHALRFQALLELLKSRSPLCGTFELRFESRVFVTGHRRRGRGHLRGWGRSRLRLALGLPPLPLGLDGLGGPRLDRLGAGLFGKPVHPLRSTLESLPHALRCAPKISPQLHQGLTGPLPETLYRLGAALLHRGSRGLGHPSKPLRLVLEGLPSAFACLHRDMEAGLDALHGLSPFEVISGLLTVFPSPGGLLFKTLLNGLGVALHDAGEL